MKHLFLTALFVSCFAHAVKAQVGINTTSPDSTALLDIHFSGTNAVGVLFPNLVDSLRMNKKGKISDGMVVFDRKRKMFYYYDVYLNEWVAMTPFGAIHGDNNALHDIRPQDSEVNTLNMSLGLQKGENATAKLDVNGDVRVRDNINVDRNAAVQQSLTVVGTTTLQQSLQVSGSTTLQRTLTVDDSTTLKSPTTINNSLTVTGNINAKNDTVTAKTFVGNGTIPVGGIIMWSGTTPPDGWVLCDGSSTLQGYETPDLRGRFIVGYGENGTNISSNVWDDAKYKTPGNLSQKGMNSGAVGGEMMHTLTTSEMPSHQHTAKYGRAAHNDSGNTYKTITGFTEGTVTKVGSDWKNESYDGGRTNSTGNSEAHENRPPYYVLAFIMRVQ